MDPINVCFESIKGKDTIIPQKINILQSVSETVVHLTDIAPVNRVELTLLADTQDVVARQVQDSSTFIVKECSAIESIED